MKSTIPDFRLRPASQKQEEYGILFVSVETIRVVGDGVYNPEFPHRVLVRRDGGIRRTLAAVAIDADKGSPSLGTVAIGDIVMIHGFPYYVRASRSGDSVLESAL